MRSTLLTLVCCGLVLAALPLAAQPPAPDKLITGGQYTLTLTLTEPLAAQPPAPKPGPEHELLKKFVGEWDVTVSFMGKESKGSASYKIDFGGFWLTEEFKGTFEGQKFEGRATTGYDPLRKKYVSTWIDSMSPSIIVMEGGFDKDGKTFTETGEGPGQDGKLTKMKNVYEFKDKDTIVFTMYNIQGGKDQQMFQITYKRK
jgi:hypothetical protein